METRMWVRSTCPWWNREVQITEFVKQWIPAQLHSEADASKDGQIRPYIQRPYPTGAGYENLAGFRPGPDMISGATLELGSITAHIHQASFLLSFYEWNYSSHLVLRSQWKTMVKIQRKKQQKTNEWTFSQIPATFSERANIPVTSFPGWLQRTSRLARPSPSSSYSIAHSIHNSDKFLTQLLRDT